MGNFKTVKYTGALPTKMQLYGSEIMSAFREQIQMSSVFSEKFQPNENQQEVFDLIRTSQVPEGEWLHVLLHGGAGSGKTTNALAYQLDLGLKIPTARFLCIRRTAAELKGTIFQDIIKFLQKFDIPYSKNENSLLITLANDSQFWMRSDKSLTPTKTNTSRALGGTQFIGAMVEEVDTVSQETVNAIPHRLRQNVGTESFRRVIFYTCNPPSRGHWVHDLFFRQHEPDDPASNYRAVHCDIRKNRKYLPVGYIEGLHKEYKDDPAMHARFFEGAFAPDTRGDVMFRKSFSYALHVAKEPFTKHWNRAFPMQRGWDFGIRGNACTIVQDDPDRRQIRIFVAHVEHNIMFEEFATRMIGLCYRLFPGAVWEDYADPSGRNRTALTSLTYHKILESKGIRPQWQDEDVAYGINLISQRLKTLSFTDNPEILINSEHCLQLIEAFASGYCNDKDIQADVIKPVKDGVYDHVMDSFRYIMIHLRRMGEEVENRYRNEIDQRILQQNMNDLYGPGPKARQAGARKPYNFGRSRFR